MLVRDPDAIWTEFGDEIFVLGLSASRYFICKGIGPFVWQALEAPLERSALMALVVERYAVAPEQAETDLDQFIAQLKVAKLVSETEAASTVP
ncbi:MAG: PqqD family protein [Sphingomonas sp.]